MITFGSGFSWIPKILEADPYLGLDLEKDKVNGIPGWIWSMKHSLSKEGHKPEGSKHDE